MISSQMLKGTLEGCILQIISRRETYGYEIAETLMRYGFGKIAEGTIYPLLLRLERNGLVLTEYRPSELGPKRKYYRLSDEGRTALGSLKMRSINYSTEGTKMNKLTRKLRDENNELEKQLSEEANAVLTDIVVYIRCANISEFNQERVRRDIDEMLLEGERRGQSVDDIIGGDYKTFCDSVISEVPQLTAAQKTMTVVSYAVMAIGIMLAIWTVFAPIRGLTQGGVWYMVNIGTVDIIEGVAVIAASFYIVDYICKNSFKPKKTLFFVGLAVIIVAFAAALVFIPKVTLLKMNIGVSVLVLAVLAAVYFALNAKLA